MGVVTPLNCDAECKLRSDTTSTTVNATSTLLVITCEFRIPKYQRPAPQLLHATIAPTGVIHPALGYSSLGPTIVQGCVMELVVSQTA